MRAPQAAGYREKPGQTLSNALQFSPQTAVLAEDFDAELDRLYNDHGAPPPGVRSGLVESAHNWIKARRNGVVRRHHVLGKLEKGVRVEKFRRPGDPMKIDYAYRNGVRGSMHSIALGRDPAQAKALAFTAECIRKIERDSEFTAITESEPAAGNARQQSIAGLFRERNISIVPLNRIETFAEDLRRHLSWRVNLRGWQEPFSRSNFGLAP